MSPRKRLKQYPYPNVFDSDVSLNWSAYVILSQPNDLTGKHSECTKTGHYPEQLANIALAFDQPSKPVGCCISTEIL